MNYKIFLITDNEKDLRDISIAVKLMGYEIISFTNMESCISFLSNRDDFSPDIMLVDTNLKGLDGFEWAKICKIGKVDIPIMIITDNDCEEIVNKALSAGVWDYVIKPLSRERLEASLNNLNLRDQLQREVGRLTRELSGDIDFSDIIGEAPEIKTLFALMRKACESDITVLIEGESGVGKELVAKAIHNNSVRHKGNLITVNCGAIPENLVESEFFGHEKGAFTGAIEKFDGKFIAANGGTLFLDEIGELALSMQVKLLRAIQEGEVTPVGSQVSMKVNVRILSATNRNLQKMVGEGSFREDLFYRINGFPLKIPALRERKSDIPILVDYLCTRFCVQNAIPIKKISPAAQNLLSELDWAGNIRQLENAIHRAVITTEGNIIEKSNLAFISAEMAELITDKVNLNQKDILPLHELEALHIKRTLLKCNGNMSQAAKLLGVSRSTLYRKLEDTLA